MKNILAVAACLILISCVPSVWAQNEPAQPRQEIADPDSSNQTDDSEESKRLERMTEAVDLPTGPMRMEFWAALEKRDYYKMSPPPSGERYYMILRFWLTGEKLVHLAGAGNAILEKVVDDTGAVLHSIADYQPEQLEALTPTRLNRKGLKSGHTEFNVTTKAPARKATKISEIKGYIDVVYAERSELITIDDPMRFLGGYIDHPELNKIGVKIKVLDLGGKREGKRQLPGLCLQYEGDAVKYIRNIEFFDSWLKPMYAREIEKEAEGVGKYISFEPMSGKINHDVQMQIRYYPEIQEERISFEFSDIPLP